MVMATISITAMGLPKTSLVTDFAVSEALGVGAEAMEDFFFFMNPFIRFCPDWA